MKSVNMFVYEYETLHVVVLSWLCQRNNSNIIWPPISTPVKSVSLLGAQELLQVDIGRIFKVDEEVFICFLS